jgi:hypothetical protein
MSDVSRTQSERDAVLVELYRCAEGNPITFVRMETLIERTSLPADRVETALVVLKEQYLVVFRASGPTLTITAEGIARAEALIEDGGPGVLAVLTIEERRDYEAKAASLREAIENSNLDPNDRLVALVDLDCVVAQLRSPEPSRHVTQAVWRHIGSFLLGLGASWAAGYIPHF